MMERASLARPRLRLLARLPKPATVVVLPLLLHLLMGAWIAIWVPFPAAIDELQHLSFVSQMKEEAKLFPDHSALVVPEKLSGHPTIPNYLSHPAPYYLMLAEAYQAKDGLQTNVLRLRFINLALATSGLFLILLAGAAALPTWGSRIVFGFALVLFPKMGVVAGLINNDNLGMLATGLVFLGLLRFMGKNDHWSVVIWGLGLALAGWTKLTVLVMLGLASGIALVLAMLAGRSLGLGKFAALGAVASLGTIPTLMNLSMNGELLFVTAANPAPVGGSPSLSLFDYFLLFLRQIAAKWAAFEPANPLQMMALAIALAVGLRTIWLHLPPLVRRREADPAVILILSFLLSLPVTLLIHVVYAHSALLPAHDLTAAQPRYYYALWPGVALACGLLYAQPATRRVKALLLAVAAVPFVTASPMVAPFVVGP